MANNSETDEKKESGSDFFTYVILSVVFFMASIPAFLFYSLLRFFRLKLSVIFSIFMIYQISLSIFLKNYEIVSIAEEAIQEFSFSSIGSSLSEVVPPVAIILAMIGGVVGLFIVIWEISQIKNNPHRTQLEGKWTYNFKYRRTPYEVYKRKQTIKNLKDGVYRTSEKAPIGIDETNPGDNLVSRYYTEATKHTMITGSIGSGKALHIDTIIPTYSNGFTTVKELQVGDTIIDELGNPTRILSKHQPLTKDHYLLEFENGEKVKACGDHLWEVITRDNEKIVLNTKTLFVNQKTNYYSIIASKEVNTEERKESNSFDKSMSIESFFAKDFSVYSLKERKDFFSFIKNSDLTTNNLLNKTFCISHEDYSILKNIRIIAASLGLNPGGIQKQNNKYSFSYIEKNNTIKINRITKIFDNPEDYYCFEVDSPNHLFLCTESFIPTHNTITMLSMMLADISAGFATVIIDFKRSPELASKTAFFAKKYNRNFYHFSSGDPELYDIKDSPGQAFCDPLATGSPTVKADMVLGMREYDTSSAVYKTNMQELLQTTFAMLKYADRKKAPKILWGEGGVFELASAIKAGNFIDLVNACEGTPIESQAQEIELSSRVKNGGIAHAINELQGQMRTIIVSDYGRWLKTPKKGSRNIDLFDLTKQDGNVILFSLDADSEPEFAKYIGSLILADLTNVSAKRRNAGLDNFVSVYVDEFQAVNPNSVMSLLEKSRESKISMTLSQQSFEQVISASENAGRGAAYLNSILETCANFIAHAGSNTDGAERLAKIIGKDWFTKYSSSNKDENFLFNLNFANKRQQVIRNEKELTWRFDPSEFQKLSIPSPSNGYKSTAIFINKSSDDPLMKKVNGATARRVWIIPDKDVIAKHYIPKGFAAVSENKVIDTEETLTELSDFDKFETVSNLNDDDGGFEFEEISDIHDDEPVIYSNSPEIDNYEDTYKEEPLKYSITKETKKKVNLPETSFDALFNSKAPKKKEVPKSKPKPKGLPKLNISSYDDDFDLPDL